MKLSIIIPVYNEQATVAEVIRAVIKVKLPERIEKEIIIIDDGSNDNSAQIIQSFTNKYKKIIFAQQKNKGKGAAVINGIKKSSGSYILIQDADLEYDPQNYIKLLHPVLHNGAKVVYGTRLNRWPNFSRDERTFRFFIHYMGNRLLSLITSILYGQWITDMETGHKLIAKDAISELKLKAKGFELEPEITAKLIKNGYNIFEIPISTKPRSYKEGKKIQTFSDGIKALKTLLYYRFKN